MPPLILDSPTIVHHMAALDHSLAPPNSLEAIAACLAAHAPFIEVDVTALANDDYLLVHDFDLESETSGQGPVSECTSGQARELFYKVKNNVTLFRVALLSDVVRLFQERPGASRLQLDFKNVLPLPNDEPLRRLLKLIEPLGERVIVSSGADWQLCKLRKLAPWLMLGFDIMYYLDWQPPGHPRDPRVPPKHLGAYGYYDDHPLAAARLSSTTDYLQDRCESLLKLVPDVSVFYVDHTLLTQSLQDGFNWAEPLHASGIKLDAWTMDVQANNPGASIAAEAVRLQRAGVDLFTSNTPHALAGVLDAAGYSPTK